MLANASSQPAHFSVYDADGSLSELIIEREIPPPAFIPTGATAVTVRSEILGADGLAVNAGFATADGVEIPAQGMAIILVDNTGLPTASEIGTNTWRVVTDRPVVAYQFGPYCCNYSYTNDASLLLPVPALNREYIHIGVPTWGLLEDDGNGGQSISGAEASLSVVAPFDGTNVHIELPAGAEIMPGGGVTQSGNQIEVQLEAGEVLNVMAARATSLGQQVPPTVDLSGSLIRSSRPVAVFSGHACTYYPQDQGACDHLEEQLFPVDVWGSEYELVPPVMRFDNASVATEAAYWKIIARDDGTRISLSAPYSTLDVFPPGFPAVPSCGEYLADDNTIELDAREFCEFGTRAAVVMSGDKPFQVMGIISGQDSTAVFGGFTETPRAGDPAIYLVPPVRQYRNDYAFLAPTTYYVDYITVITPPGANMILDGSPVNLSGGQPDPRVIQRLCAHRDRRRGAQHREQLAVRDPRVRL